MLSKICGFIFKIFGWSVTGYDPALVKKAVIIVVPHTSNWDFPKGILLRNYWKTFIGYVGKASLFKFPFGGIMKWFGGIPVDRSKNNNFVDAVVELFNSREELKICIAPEGTRKRVDKLKSGFYYIALGAKIPVLMIKFDYENKVIDCAEPFQPKGDLEHDMKIVDAYFKGVKGKYPERSYY